MPRVLQEKTGAVRNIDRNGHDQLIHELERASDQVFGPFVMGSKEPDIPRRVSWRVHERDRGVTVAARVVAGECAIGGVLNGECARNGVARNSVTSSSASSLA